MLVWAILIWKSRSSPPSKFSLVQGKENLYPVATAQMDTMYYREELIASWRNGVLPGPLGGCGQVPDLAPAAAFFHLCSLENARCFSGSLGTLSYYKHSESMNSVSSVKT